MSSILKALKRLEQEKATRKPEYIRIDAEILKSGSSRKLSSAALVIAACAVFASGGIAAYLFLKREAPPASAIKPQAPLPTTAGTAGSAVTAAPPASESVSSANRNAPPTTTLNPRSERPVSSSQPVIPRQQSRVEKAAEAGPSIPSTTQVSEQKSAAVAPVVPPAKQTLLKLDGIAFQDGGSDNLAVINGTTVSKGSVVEGARVEEIQKDRVKFSRGGEKFEIILDKSN
jgi:general secretion pathway protein B